jgi:hypothetical protein
LKVAHSLDNVRTVGRVSDTTYLDLTSFVIFLKTSTWIPREYLEIGFRFNSYRFYEGDDKINRGILELPLDISFLF